MGLPGRRPVRPKRKFIDAVKEEIKSYCGMQRVCTPI